MGRGTYASSGEEADEDDLKKTKSSGMLATDYETTDPATNTDGEQRMEHRSSRKKRGSRGGRHPESRRGQPSQPGSQRTRSLSHESSKSRSRSRENNKNSSKKRAVKRETSKQRSRSRTK